LQAVRQLPRDARIAGVSDQLDVLPALTGRAIAAAPEQAIPWHMGYYRPFERDLRLSLLAVSTSDRALVAQALERSRADYLLVDRVLLETSRIPPRYGQVVPDAVASAERSLQRGRSLVQRSAARCAIYRGSTAWLLDGKCLARRADPGFSG
jgi:hypothetical protein